MSTRFKPLFLQVHTLTSYPATLLNRDDQGFAKRIPFGGVTRTRISSQCLKRHWRTFEGEYSIGSVGEGKESVELSVRSRYAFERFVVEPLLKEGVSAELARAATEAIMQEVLGESAKAKRAREGTREEPNDDAKSSRKGRANKPAEPSEPTLMTGQITVLGKPELDFFLAEARKLASAAGSADKVAEAKKKQFTRDWSKNLEGLKRAAGLDAALFGRMVTSSKLARADAAIHVAHAFTVHAEQSETDYFAAIDDLLASSEEPEQLGSGHIGNAELTTGLFYGYVVVDVAQLISNLEGCAQRDWLQADRSLAAEVVRNLIQLVARVSPGAKLGSTAPHAFAHLTLVEAGSSQPRTLANAFLRPVAPVPDLLANTYDALARYVSEVDSVYGLDNRRALAAIAPTDALNSLGSSMTLDAVAKFGAGAILEYQ
jgi:CRISPR system Cascade subunit CasC